MSAASLAQPQCEPSEEARFLHFSKLLVAAILFRRHVAYLCLTLEVPMAGDATTGWVFEPKTRDKFRLIFSYMITFIRLVDRCARSRSLRAYCILLLVVQTTRGSVPYISHWRHCIFYAPSCGQVAKHLGEGPSRAVITNRRLDFMLSPFRH